MAIFAGNAAQLVNISFNVAAFIDHQTGIWVEGTRGNMILVGGYSHNTGILALNNTGKTELLLEMYTKVCYRYPVVTSAFYETEGTMQPERIENYYHRWDPEGTIIDSEQHEIMDSTLYIDQWYNMLLKEKHARAKRLASGKGLVTLPFDYSAKYKNKMLPPLLLPVDSYSEAGFSEAESKIDAKGVMDKSNQTYDMIVGNLKTRIQHGFAQFANTGHMFVIMTAVLDKFVNIDARPGVPVPKHTAHLAANQKPKGVGSKFKGLTSNCWTFGIPKPAWKGTGKADQVPKYPEDESELFPGNKTYEHTELLNTRGKSGGSGFVTPMWKKQGTGLLMEMSELEFIRSWGDDNPKLSSVLADYGITSTAQYTYEFDLVPGVTWRNTTLRPTMAKNPQLMRAIEILFGLKYEIYKASNPLFTSRRCTPKELHDDLKAMGYDWNILLDTRYWWTYLECESKFKPELSTLDLLRMRTGEYIPYWFTKEQKAGINLALAKPQT